MTPRIPLVDLKAQYLSIKSDIDLAIAQTLERWSFIGGESVSAFERAFARHLGVAHCIGCANGTDSLELILKALKIGSGDEVIVPAHTWISTSEAVTTAGAQVVFADTDRDTYTLSPSELERRITPRTRAVIPVHLYGQPADLDPILALARRHHLRVIEDCAQAHGAEYRGARVGTFGDAASFSFFPGKNLGAYGDAGAVVTNDPDLATRVRMLANHGRLGKFDHAVEGRNSRLDSLQAAILLAKLPHLDRWIEYRRAVASHYGQRLTQMGIEPPRSVEGRHHAYHLYVIEVDNREALREHLAGDGVETGIHYPRALPLLSAYARLGHVASDFPVAVRATGRVLSLPMFPELTEPQVATVCNSIQAAIATVRP